MKIHLRRLVVAAAALACLAFAGPALAPSAARAAPADVGEIRELVPFGKSDDRFGRVTEAPPNIKTPPSTPLQVRLLASRAPALSEPVTITLQAHAFENAPATDIGIRLPQGAELLEGSTHAVVDLEADQTRELTVVAALRKPGEQTIEGHASRAVSEEESWGDDDALFLTVEKDAGFVGHRSGDDAELEAIRVSDDLPGEPQTVDATPAGGDQPLAVPGVETDSGDMVDIAICWTLPDRSGSSTPFRDARVQFIDDDSGPDDVLASGFADYGNGCASAAVWNRDRDEGGEIDVFARLRMEHLGRYRIQNLAGTVFSCDTTTQNDVAADLSLGTQQCGGSTGNDRAAWIYDDVYRLHRFVDEHRAGKGDPPGQCTAQWQTGSTDGTFYSLTDMRAHLMDADAGSRDTVAHECSHAYMHTAYGGWTSVSDCPNPHFINRVSGKSCAWSEGWTYVAVAGADGDPNYTWPGGAFLNLETPNCLSPGWANGPDVEGRVGGTLIDLLDPFTLSFGTVNGFGNEPFVANCVGVDDRAGLFGSIWSAITSQNDDVFVVQGNLTDSFSRAWQAAGHTAGRGRFYEAGGQFVYCPRAGNCMGALNTIPTFGLD